MTAPLTHELLEYRLGTGLSQEDMAFLLGVSGKARVSNHERFKRLPDLNRVFAYVAIHQRSVEELFGGRYLVIAAEVLGRARQLRDRMRASGSRTRKVEYLNALILVLERGFDPNHD